MLISTGILLIVSKGPSYVRSCMCAVPTALRVAFAVLLLAGAGVYWLHTHHQQELMELEVQLHHCHSRYEGYTLPVLPRPDDLDEALAKLGRRWQSVPLPAHNASSSPPSSGHGIPKIIWQTMKRVPAVLPGYTLDMERNNPGWRLLAMDDADVDLFMHTVFARTSLLWAYKNINPQLGAMKVRDILSHGFFLPSLICPGHHATFYRITGRHLEVPLAKIPPGTPIPSSPLRFACESYDFNIM